jgi:outer membrane immunogenic protein
MHVTVDRGIIMRHIATALLATTALFVGLAQSASAADRGVPYRAPPPPPPAPVASWTGCYVGGHVGAGWGTKTWSDRAADDFSDNASYGVNGFLGGAQIGCDYQWYGPVVIGAEGSFSWSDIKGSGALPFEAEQSVFNTKIDWLTTAAGRIGFTADKALIYVKGGAAWVGEKHTLREIDPEDGFAQVTRNSNRVGWLFGAGLEYLIVPGWSAKIEYNYIDFGTKDFVFTPLADDPAGVKQQLHTIKFGVNYRFGGYGYGSY